MKYIAKPVQVEAFVIRQVLVAVDSSRGTPLLLAGLDDVYWATPEMTARMTPQVGDYWVIQADGYVYLNPKDVFERKYAPLDELSLKQWLPVPDKA